MINDKIVKYYLLSTVRMGSRKHIVNELPDRKIELVFTKKEIDLFLRIQDGQYVAKEIVIGGQSQSENICAHGTIVID